MRCRRQANTIDDAIWQHGFQKMGSQPPPSHDDSLKYNDQELPYGYIPRNIDVLCGRGKGNSKHPGNRIFTDSVRGSLQLYTEAKSRADKSIVIASMASSLKNEIGVKFIKFDQELKRYVQLTQDQVHEKVGHAIRDILRQQQQGNVQKTPFSANPAKKEKKPYGYYSRSLNEKTKEATGETARAEKLNRTTGTQGATTGGSSQVGSARTNTSRSMRKWNEPFIIQPGIPDTVASLETDLLAHSSHHRRSSSGNLFEVPTKMENSPKKAVAAPRKRRAAVATSTTNQNAHTRQSVAAAEKELNSNSPMISRPAPEESFQASTFFEEVHQEEEDSGGVMSETKQDGLVLLVEGNKNGTAITNNSAAAGANLSSPATRESSSSATMSSAPTLPSFDYSPSPPRHHSSSSRTNLEFMAPRIEFNPRIHLPEPRESALLRNPSGDLPPPSSSLSVSSQDIPPQTPPRNIPNRRK